jgi:unspecific monooxygenase
MRAHHQAMLSVANDLAGDWASSSSSVIDINAAMTHATLEVISRAGFGEGLGLIGDRESSVDNPKAFIDALGRTLVWASESTNDLPVLGHIRARLRRRQLNDDIAKLQSTVDHIIGVRGSDNEAKSTDLLNLMLTTADPQTGELLDHDNVRNQILTFLVAGHETTASLLETTLFYVAQESSLQEQLRTEASQLKSVDYAYSAVAGLRLIRATLNEVLRLWPPIPGLFRVSRHDQNLGGYRIPAGRAVFVLSLAAQRDPEVWGPSADDFDPFRAKPERDAYFRPWGIGPRSCIGRAFALHEATLILAHLLNNFRLSPPNHDRLQIRERGSLRPEAYSVEVTRIGN